MNEEERRIAQAFADKVGVPADMLAAVVDEPLPAEERKRIQSEYGLDATLSRQNAIEAAALRLRDRLEATKGDEAAVIREVAGGDGRVARRLTNRRTAIGKQMPQPTPAPVDAPLQPAPMAPPAGESDGGVPMVPEGALRAYAEGRMKPDDAIAMEIAVERGEFSVPQGFALRRTEKTMGDTARDVPVVGGGLGAAVDAAAAVPDVVAAIPEIVTGAARRTATTEAATDVTLSPQMQQARVQALSGLPMNQLPPGASLADQVKQGIKTGAMAAANTVTGGLVGAARLAGLESAPQREQMQVLAANTPGMQVVTDEKGNQSFVGPDGVTYSEKPGARVTDIPRVVASVAPALVPGAMAARGGMTALGGAMATQAGIQAAQEAAQAEMGGEFNPADVALAGAAEGVAPLVRGIKGALRPAAEAATEAAPAAAKAGGAPIVESRQLGRDIRAAAGGDAEALARVASLAAVDKEAAKAAEDLGIDLPLNVLADGPQVREGFDAVISKLSGPERAAFKDSEVALAKRADEVLSSFDAAFSDGRVAPGEVSKKVADAMAATRDQVEAKAKALYRQVDEVVPNESIAKMDAVRLQIMKRAEQVGNEGLSAPERAILEKIKEGDTPLGLIRQEKNLIGQAVGRLDAASPYASMEKGAMKALYAALAADEAANVARIGGEEAARMLKKAHGFTKVQKGLEERAVAAFGKLQDGDLSPLMKRALTNAVSDDNKALRQLMKIVPDANKREVLATAIAGLGRDTGGRFSPAKFADAYPGLWKNKVARELIREHLGPEADKMLGALAAVSKRVAYANKRVPKTGESLQELARMDAQGLLSKVMSTGLGRFAAVGAVGAIPGIGNALATLMAVAPSRGKGATLEAMSALLRDDAFAKLAIDMANGTAKPADIKRMARSARFRAFLKAAKEPADPASAEKWLTAGARGAMLGGDREPVAKEPKL